MKRSAPARTAANLGDRSYLEAMFRSMWPAPNDVTAGRRARRGPASRAVEEFTVLPTLDRPRIVVPRARRAAAASLGADGHESGVARLRRDGLAILFRAGGGQLLGTRVRVAAGPDNQAESITTHLRDVLGRPVHVAFRVGPARGNRKPVLRLLDDSGRTVAFAKIGISDLTSSLVRAEAGALADLKRRQPRTFTAADVLHHGEWRGLEILVQSVLPRSGERAVGAGTRQAAMVEIAGGGDAGAELDLMSSPYWKRLIAEVGAGRDEFSAALTEALGRAARRLAGAQVRFGAWHGDWTPWNMAMGAGSLLVWDWERYDPDVPLGFDALHFHFQKIKFGRDPADAIAEVDATAPALLAPFGIDPQLSSITMVLYAATLASRYAGDFAAMGDRTWRFRGSNKLGPLTEFVGNWAGPA